MKIGIITIQKCDNFGADLQAYALGAKLRKLGYDAENIDYLFYKHPRHLGGVGERPIFKLSFLNRVKESLLPLVSRLRRLRNGSGSLRRSELFREFFAKNVPCGSEYRSVQSLYDSPPEYDVYVTGSDQVWNPRMGSNIKPYFLDFVPPGKRCVSYASSIGVPTISPTAYETYRKLLSRYSAIGVREATSERIIAGMGLVSPVKTVLDPTLLLTADEWQMIARPPDGVAAGNYVAEYNLTHNPAIHQLALRIADKIGVRVVDVTDGCFGPAEFLWLMGHASASVCSSFHGTVFSIINRVPFYSVYSDGAGSNGGRIALFARSLGLESRMVKTSELGSVRIDLHVDYDAVHGTLRKRREDSVEFLVRSVKGELDAVRPRKDPDCYAIWTKDSAIRAKSTSGGAFYLLASQVIRQGGVVFGAAYDADCKHVRHRAARTLDELAPLMRSKYVYSDFAQAIGEVGAELQAGRKVLFVGTPCQVAAIKAKYGDGNGGLTTVDFVCHGTPRPECFASWVTDLENAYHDRVSDYEFRNKAHGWNFSESRVRFVSGRVLRLRNFNDPYFMGFSLNVFLRDCCYSCRFANLDRPGDMTIADCWRVATSNPEYDDGRGTSLLLVNSEAGRMLFGRLDENAYAGGAYDIRLARLRNMPLMIPAARSSYAAAFEAEYRRSRSFVQAAKCYFTSKRQFCSWLRGAIKRIGWFYLKRHQ